METFLVAIHVIFVIFIIGPMVAFPLVGLQGVRSEQVAVVKAATRGTSLYGWLSVLSLLTGLLIIPFAEKENGVAEFTFATVWINISLTLYIITLLVIVVLVIPTLRKAGRLMSGEKIPEEIAGGVSIAAASEVRGKEAKIINDVARKARLDELGQRLGMFSGIVSVLVLVIAVFMVVKPFS